MNGVSEFGIGKWKDVKTKYFLTSIRTSINLKVYEIIINKLHDVANTSSILLGTVIKPPLLKLLDKWKNLVKACKKVIFCYIFLALTLSLRLQRINFSPISRAVEECCCL